MIETLTGTLQFIWGLGILFILAYFAIRIYKG
jgi:hypothetical protein